MNHYCAVDGGFYSLAFHGHIPAGCVEVSDEDYQALIVGQEQGRWVVANAEGYPVLTDPPVVPPTLAELCALIDDAADSARAAVAGDPLRAVEYQRSADQAQAFKDAGYPPEAVPPMVAAWAIRGRTPEIAADDILREANAYYAALTWIRATRLAAKELVRELVADSQHAYAETLARQTVADIQAEVTGIGNNVAPDPVEGGEE